MPNLGKANTSVTYAIRYVICYVSSTKCTCIVQQHEARKVGLRACYVEKSHLFDDHMSRNYSRRSLGLDTDGGREPLPACPPANNCSPYC